MASEMAAKLDVRIPLAVTLNWSMWGHAGMAWGWSRQRGVQFQRHLPNAIFDASEQVMSLQPENLVYRKLDKMETRFTKTRQSCWDNRRY
jgi:hypothetical protein